MEDQKPDQTAPEDKKASALAELSTRIYGLFTLGILYTLYLAHQIVLPIILAVLTSLLLSPLVKRARVKWHVPRVVSSLVLLLVVLASIVGLGAAVTAPALEWAERAPQGCLACWWAIARLCANWTRSPALRSRWRSR